MPTYDYRCSNCGHELEAFQAMSEDPLTDCPNCGTPRLRRLISGGTGVIFRGGGFYVTDSRGGGAKRKAEKTGSAGSGDTSAPTDSPSSTPAAAPSTDGSASKSTDSKERGDKPVKKTENSARRAS